MASGDIPILVRHVALAIYKSGDVRGASTLEKAIGAFDIARHRLTEYGFLRKGSEKGKPSKIKMTVKGHKADAKHRSEVGSKTKTKEWDKLYSLISEAEEEPVDSGAMNEVSGLPAASSKPGPKARKKQDQVRRARVAKRRTTRARVPRAKKAKRG